MRQFTPESKIHFFFPPFTCDADYPSGLFVYKKLYLFRNHGPVSAEKFHSGAASVPERDESHDRAGCKCSSYLASLLSLNCCIVFFPIAWGLAY